MPTQAHEPPADGRRHVLYDLVVLLVNLILRIFFRVEVTGQENIPDGGCLVVSNHLSWTDTAFIVHALPRLPRIHTMANRSTVFNSRWKRWLLPRLCVFPVSRQRGMLDLDAVNAVYRLLEHDERVLIFPEGAYGKDGQLRPLRDGIGYFAINSSRPILPIVLTGTGRLRPFSRVTVAIGEPFIPKVPVIWDVKRRARAAVDAVAVAFRRLGSRVSAPSSGLEGAPQVGAVEGRDPPVATPEAAGQQE